MKDVKFNAVDLYQVFRINIALGFREIIDLIFLLNEYQNVFHIDEKIHLIDDVYMKMYKTIEGKDWGLFINDNDLNPEKKILTRIASKKLLPLLTRLVEISEMFNIDFEEIKDNLVANNVVWWEHDNELNIVAQISNWNTFAKNFLKKNKDKLDID